MSHFVVFVALAEEAQQVHNYLMGQGFSCGVVKYNRNIDRYYFTKMTRHTHALEIFLYVMSDMGNLRIASKVQPILSRERPVAVIMAGIAGTLDPENVRLGDVVVATGAKALYADALKRRNPKRELFVEFKDGKPKEPVPPADDGEPEYIQIDQRKRIMSDSFFRFRREFELVSQSLGPLQRYASADRIEHLPLPLQPVILHDADGIETYRNDAPKIRTGTIFGSNFVVDSDEFVAFLGERNTVENDYDLGKWDYYNQRKKPEDRDRNKWVDHPLMAVDMETLGFFSAVNGWGQAALLAFAVRGISDQASNKEMTDTGGGGARAVAAQNATAVVLDLINYLINNSIVRIDLA